MRRLVIASVLCLSACGTQGLSSSYVDTIDPKLAPAITAGMAGFVRARLQPDAGAVQVEQSSGDLMFGPHLVSDLKDAGFTVKEHGAKHRIRYAAANMGENIIVRVSVDHTDAARLYGKGPAGLAPLGPFSITEIGE